jgi:hypothetical protein
VVQIRIIKIKFKCLHLSYHIRKNYKKRMNIYIYLTFLLDTDIFPLLIKLGARKFICVLINCVSLYQPTANSARILGTRGHLHTAA